MKAILTFEYAPEDRYDMERIRRLMKADDMAHVLYCLSTGHDLNGDEIPELVQRTVSDWCHDNNINFEELWS